MRFTKFIIENYRGIQDSVEINIAKNTLVPIIGVNETGKTTILHAIFAFDYVNDTLNHGGEHLQDIRNLYQTKERPAYVSAELDLTPDDFMAAMDDATKKLREDDELTDSLAESELRYRGVYRTIPKRLVISRNLTTKSYEFLDTPILDDVALNDLVARSLLAYLPYVLYFDDFRDAIEDEIEIKKDSSGRISDWLGIIAQLFRQVDPDFTVFDVPTADPRIRDAALAKVSRHINAILSKEWQTYRLDDTEALKLEINYEKESVEGGGQRHLLRFRVVERDANGDYHYFYIANRSKGFFWFFNFVMKLEFNPKLHGSEAAVCLLDEPGSYLHSSAQSKLCRKLKTISESSIVIYCTHSHNLLNPEHIPLSSINIADKDGKGNVRLFPIYGYKGKTRERRMAFQPVVDALQIKPFLLDMSPRTVVITEGIYDYYAFDMFKPPRSKIGILPSVNANSIKFYVSLMIAWDIDYRAIWDNDQEGRREFKKSKDAFGEEQAKNRFFLLPAIEGHNRILQDLFDGSDLVKIRSELGLARDAHFDQTMAALYFSKRKKAVLGKVSPKTKENFRQAFVMLGLCA